VWRSPGDRPPARLRDPESSTVATAPIHRTLVALTAVVALLGAGCSARAQATPKARSTVATSATAPRHVLGTFTTTWVDTSRPTNAHGSAPATSSRWLRTVYTYPAAPPPGPAATIPIGDALPDRTGAPYPLVVFAHGFNSRPEAAADQIADLASRGFVVASPTFPLTSFDTVGGADGGDLRNQPADVSFVITRTLALARDAGGPLSGMIDPRAVAVGGHSAGAITALGLASTCCHDERVKALFLWSGNPQGFAGRFDLRHAPPLLLVHGTEDPFLPYNEDVATFNDFHVPKVFLTMVGEDHSSWASRTDDSFDEVMTTTADFLDTFLRNDRTASARLARGARTPRYRLVADLAAPFDDRIDKLASPARHRRATVTPSTALDDGQTVTVAWNDYTPGRVVNVVQCSGPEEAACDIGRGRVLYPDPTGRGSLALEVHTGAIGTGACEVGRTGCSIVVNDSALSDPTATIRIPITFG
jgi:dienelactone hydrolase